jgi:hypothetical protein
MLEPAKEYSPFDDDHEEQSRAEQTERLSPSKRWFRYCLYTSAVFLVLAIASSIVANNAAGDRNLEDTAYLINRLFMGALLLSCAGLFLSVRGPTLMAAFRSRSERRAQGEVRAWSPWFSLFVWSWIGWFAACVFFGSIAGFLPGIGVLAPLLLLPVLISMAIMIAVSTRNELRAYAIGMAVTLFLSSLNTIGLWFGLLSPMMYGYRGGYGFNAYGFATQWLTVTLGVLAWGAITGLICSGYVTLQRWMSGKTKTNGMVASETPPSSDT